MENLIKEVEWDYNPPENSQINDKSIFVYEQKDWNQTLLTQINYISAIRHQNYHKLDTTKPIATLNVPIKFKPILLTLFFYDSETDWLAGRYVVIYVNDDVDYLELDGFKVNIINFNKK